MCVLSDMGSKKKVGPVSPRGWAPFHSSKLVDKGWIRRFPVLTRRFQKKNRHANSKQHMSRPASRRRRTRHNRSIRRHKRGSKSRRNSGRRIRAGYRTYGSSGYQFERQPVVTEQVGGYNVKVTHVETKDYDTVKNTPVAYDPENPCGSSKLEGGNIIPAQYWVEVQLGEQLPCRMSLNLWENIKAAKIPLDLPQILSAVANGTYDDYLKQAKEESADMQRQLQLGTPQTPPLPQQYLKDIVPPPQFR